MDISPTYGQSNTTSAEEHARGFQGPVSGDMWKRVRRLNGRYRDTFDYGIYDSLYERFGENQPRGGVVFRNFIKLQEAPDCRHCFYRFEIDTYGRGCTFNCAYCYAKSYLSIRKYWNEPIPFPIDVSLLRKIFHTIFETDKPHKLRGVMTKRIPIRIGSMSDAFMHLDRKYKVTQELLKILKFYRYPYIIFTRSDLVGEEEYLRLLDAKLCSVQMSLSSINSKMVKLIEPGAPSPEKRLAAMKRLSLEGFWTTIRINPLFPIYPDGYYTDPGFNRKSDVKPFDYFSWDMIPSIAEHNVQSVLAGVVRLYLPNLRFMKEALGYDFRQHFGENEMQRASFHFSEGETQYYYQRIRDLCSEHGLRFSTCYIGNDASGDSFFKYQSMWDNKKDCCDAIGNVQAFQRTCADIRPQPSLSTETHETLTWN